MSFLGRRRVARNASSQGGRASPPSDGPSRPADDFNRVILPMKRGQEYTDYINASFIDVSARQSRVRARVPAPGGLPVHACPRWEGRTCLRNPLHFVSRITRFKRMHKALAGTPHLFILSLVCS